MLTTNKAVNPSGGSGVFYNGKDLGRRWVTLSFGGERRNV